MAERDLIPILITSAGGPAGMNCIDALRSQTDLNVKLVAVDANPLSAGIYRADVWYKVPFVHENNYIDVILDICRRERISVILPTFPVEIPIFSRNISLFEKESVGLLVPPPEAIRIFGSKLLTYQFFKDNAFLTPNTWLIDEIPDSCQYPLFLKPIHGVGSKDSYRLDSAEDLAFYQKKVSYPCIVQQFITGREITIDAVANHDAEVVAALPRERLGVQLGMSMLGRMLNDFSFFSEVQRVVSISGLVGPINLQGFIRDGEFIFGEVNPRFAAGGLSLTTAAGVNIPLIVVKLILGLSVSPPKKINKDLIMIRYYSTLFVRETEAGSYQLLED
jgi:carbamoyl-phosphate synthase large subunit